MIDRFKISFGKSKRLSSLLGLSLDGSRLEGVVLRRTNGSLQVQQTVSAVLSLDPLTASPELVGREIQNVLDAAGVKERHCVLGLPVKWALTTHVDVPALPDQDLAGFLQIEAERALPCDVDTLHLANSRCRIAAGKQQALIVGMPRTQLALIERALRAARLKPISFSLGITSLQPPGLEASEGVLALGIGDTHVALQVTANGGIAALRTLEGALEVEGGRRRLHADLVARETRITLGQLPADLRETVRHVRIFGPRDLSQELADELDLRLEAMGLKIEVVTRYGDNEFGLKLPAETPVSPALSLAAEQLAGRKTAIELLPPRISAWQLVAARYSSGKLRTVGAAAAVVVAIVLGAFLIQQWQLTRYRSKWAAMAPKVHELDLVQQQIRQFRPWADDSFRALVILRQLTMAFPEDGVVSAKTVEIRDLNAVTCTGTTRDNQSLIKTRERLRSSGMISDLRTPQIRGTKPPLQFTLEFHWNEGGASEN
jgi:hypothetical protein